MPVQLFLEPAQLRRVNREFVQYVRRNFPMRFYSGESWWSLYAAAGLLRMCDSVDAIMALLARRTAGDAQTLLRSLYEQCVVFAWVAADPDVRHPRWEGEHNRQLLTRHNELLPYGETLLSPSEVERCKAAVGTPPAEVMAREVDDYWSARLTGLYAKGHLFSFHGFYQSIYRLGSQPAHGSITALESYIQREPYPPRVIESTEHPMIVYSMAAPLLGMALAIAAGRFAWIDERRIRRFVDRATAETARRRASGRSGG